MRRSLLVLFAVAWSAPAFAHQSSIKYIELTIAGSRADIAFKLAPGDVAEPMKLSPDARPAPQDAARAPGVPAYVASWLAISEAGVPCPASPPRAHADVDNFVVVTWSVTCPAAIAHLTLDLDRLFAVDKRMEAIVQVASGDDVTPIVVRAGDSPITLHVGSRALGRWVHYGMDQLAELDPIAFVLAMLVVVVIERRGTWQVRRIARALAAAGATLAAFTAAHVLALVVGGLGWVTLSPPLVGDLVAAAIAALAAESITRPDLRGRLVLIAGFGLVFGLGFAGQLRQVAGAGLGSLACFAIGLELALLTIALIALPLCYLLASLVGGERYRRIAIPLVGGILFVFGVLALLRRGFGM